MKLGKALGIASIIFVLLGAIFTVISLKTEPKIPEEVMKLIVTDQEEYYKKFSEILEENKGYATASSARTITLGLALIVSIVSLIMVISKKEEGKYIPIIALILTIVVFFCGIIFSEISQSSFMLGVEEGMNMAEEN